jgi:3-oxoacyl-[acyl-carrier protein] reductase
MRHFSVSGYRMWGFDNDIAALEIARQSKRDLPTARFMGCDVSRAEEVEQAVDAVFKEGGGLDIVLNNAAILRDQTLVARLGKRVKKHSIDDWSATLATNLTGTFLVAREVAARWLEDRKRGLIINTASVVRTGNAGQSAYSATKAAVDALTVTWSKELSIYGIRVAAISYGFAETGMTRRIPSVFLDRIKSGSTVGRFADVDELVHGVRFICENEYFAGRVLELDGGLRF